MKNNKMSWKTCSSSKEGLHEVISPVKSDCKVVSIYRLNLCKDNLYELKSDDLEMNALLISGKAQIKSDKLNNDLSKYDSFYIPGNTSIVIKALENVIFYIGAAPCEGVGEQYYRKYKKDLPLGEIHQIHGEGISSREVFFTLNQEVNASRLICGITWGGDGSWTSWPPHEHEKYLEEVYCYFDINNFGMHISYIDEGNIEEAAVHVVKSGDMVLAPKGYHPTVASPGTKNIYFWVLASFDQPSRRYDLAKSDKYFS